MLTAEIVEKALQNAYAQYIHAGTPEEWTFQVISLFFHDIEARINAKIDQRVDYNSLVRFLNELVQIISQAAKRKSIPKTCPRAFLDKLVCIYLDIDCGDYRFFRDLISAGVIPQGTKVSGLITPETNY